MRRLNAIATVAAASTAISGCASLGLSDSRDPLQGPSWAQIQSVRGAVVRAGQSAPAPAGLVAFCQRLAEACGAPEDEQTQQQADIIPAAWASGAVRPRQGWAGSPGEDGAAIFARLLLARMHGAEAHFTRQEIALDEAGWSELAAINRQVNDQIVASTDASRYGVLEYWAMPLAERAARQNESAAGDCEDYALEKRARLISLGWNPNSLALAVAYAPGVGMHAVLIVQTDHGDFVLDNLHDAPLQPEALDYQWVSRQAGPSMTVWASAHIESAPSRLDPAQELLHASLDPAAGEVAPEVPVALLSTVIEPSS